MFFLALFVLLAVVQALGPQTPHTRPSGLPTYNPQGTNLNGNDFSKWVATQSASGSKSVALAQGQYNVQSDFNTDFNAYIVFQQLSGMTIWMDQVNLTLPDNTITAFVIDTCDSVTTYGPTVWWNTPGFGQATITQVQKQDNSYQIEFQCDAGYNCTSMFNNGQLYTEYTDPKTGSLQPGDGWSVFSGPYTTVNDNTWQWIFDNAYFEPLTGYKLLSRGTFLFCNHVQNSNQTSINDYTALNCGGFFWFSSGNIRTMFNSVSLRPATFPPPGGTALPARAGSADGIHSASDFVGPQIDSCLISVLDDDCIAIHGSLSNTTSVSGNTFKGTVGANVGDTILFLTPTNFAPLGNAKVVQTADGGNTITVDALPNGFQAGATVYSNSNRNGNGFSITNTHTTTNRGRGAIVKASNGVIANNVFEKVTYAAIYLGPEFGAWGEASYVSNISVTDNQIRDCGYIDLGVSAFSVHGDTDAVGSSDTSLNPINGNSDIRISNLLISGTGSPSNIYIGASTDVSMTGVIIEDALQADYTVNDVTRNALVNFQNVRFTGTVGICQRNTGCDDPDIAMVQNYGTVDGGISTIPEC